MKPLLRSGLCVQVTAVAMFAVFCLLRVPASLFTGFLPAGIELKNVEGSVWNGQAAAVGIGGVLVQESVAWRFLPASLSDGAIEWSVSGRFGDRPSRLNVVVGPGGIEVRGFDIVAPLEPFAALHSRLRSAQLGGTLHAVAREIATASVELRRVFSALLPREDFGDYRLDIDASRNGTGKWRLVTASGKLGVVGDGVFDAQRSQIKGRLVVTPQESLPGIASMLSELAREGEGYRVEF